MKFIHAREFFDDGQAVRVDCDTQCNVIVTDDSNFHSYQHGQRFSYLGGHFKMFPAVIRVPHAGYWNITIDLAGGSANIRYNIQKVG
jgi:hypothetical protein